MPTKYFITTVAGFTLKETCEFGLCLRQAVYTIHYNREAYLNYKDAVRHINFTCLLHEGHLGEVNQPWQQEPK